MSSRINDQGLIPGLPEELAIECISRIPHSFLSKIRPVSKKWCDLISGPLLYSHRLRINASERLFFLIQADPVTPSGECKEPIAVKKPAYSLNLFNSTLAAWHKVLNSVPVFTQSVVVGTDLVLLGGWDPETLDPIREVRILDLRTMIWREGKPMTTARSFFACAEASGRVFVAGGHDAQKNALRSAEVYDVAGDCWKCLPEMKEERDECKGLSLNGKFCVVSGYGTENQGRFCNSAEYYDEVSNQWIVLEDVWDDDKCVSVFGLGEKMMSLDSRGLREFVYGEGWRELGPVPDGAKLGTCCARVGEEESVVAVDGSGNGAWSLDLKSKKWVRVESGLGFNGFVYSGCSVRI